MASARLGAPVQFLPTPDDPTVQWPLWKRMFENYLLASATATESVERKRAILLHSLGPEGQRIFYTLPEFGEQDADVYVKAMATLDAQFAPTVSVVAERYRFRQREQLPNEAVDSYMASLRELASTCNFGTFSDEMLRDQLVEKTNSPRIRERLLIETDLKLDKAIKLARQVETAVKESKSMSGKPDRMCAEVNSNWKYQSKSRGRNSGNSKSGQKQKPDEPARDGRPGSTSSPPKKCYRCGSEQHLANFPRCPARNETCKICRKKGHNEVSCRRGKRVQQVNIPETSDEDVQVLSTNSKNSRSKKSVECAVTVNSVNMNLIVDTASDVSLMSLQLFDKHFVRDALEPCLLPITGYTSHKISTVGSFKAKVKYKDKSTLATFHVVEKGSSLLGKDLIQTLGIDIQGSTLSCFATNTKVMGDLTNSSSICNTTPTSSSSSGASAPGPQNRSVSPDIKSRFPRLFSGKLGKVKGFRHRVKIRPEVKPVQQKLRRLPFTVRDAVSAELKRLEEAEIIEKAEASEWCSPIVVAWKKSGDIRICVDLRKPNEAVIDDKFPLPTIDEMLSDMHGSTHFSKLDLKSAYFQLELDPESRDLTCFITHEGTYRFRRVCFGLSSAPTCFQKMMSTILADIPGVKCFIDDIVIHGRDKSSHDKALYAVLHRLDERDITLNDKCEFDVPTMKVLGYTIDEHGVSPNADLVTGIVDAAVPENKQQLRSFLGLAGFYSKFVPNFSTKVSAMREVQNTEPFNWTDDADRAFRDIKSGIVNSPGLALFDPDLDVIVTTDASGYGLGGILTQIQRDGSEVMVACASRTLTAAERNYSVGEREALACIWAIERWHTYLWGRHFTLRTDHQSFVTLLSSTGTGHRPMRIARWNARLLHYHYTVEFKPGSQNKIADTLSRLPIPTSDAAIDEDDCDAVCQVVLTDSSSAITRTELKDATNEDEGCTQLRTYLNTGWPESNKRCPIDVQPYFRIRNELSVHEGIVFRGERVVVPAALTSRLVTLAHENHQGIVRTKQRLRDLYWWPKIDIHSPSPSEGVNGPKNDAMCFSFHF